MKWIFTTMIIYIVFLCGVLIPENVEARLIIILRDKTDSFAFLRESDAKIKSEILPYLAPNDRVLIGDVGNFSIEQFWFYSCPVAYIDTIYANYFDFKRKNHALEKVWEETNKARSEIQKWLENPLNKSRQVGGVTSVHKTLNLVGTAISNSQHEEAYLFVFSDMLNTEGTKETPFPPKDGIEVPRTHVWLLYAEWRDKTFDFKKVQDAWGSYFSGYDSFHFLDPLSSKMARGLLPKSRVSRQLPPFKPVD